LVPRFGTAFLGSVEFNRGTPLTLRATSRSLAAVAELTEIVRTISRRIVEVGLGDKQAILEAVPGAAFGHCGLVRPQR
jgi:hypothetical protein